MMIGRGATTCLICNKEGTFVLNNPATSLGIGLLYSTDKFNLMLSCTHICIKCTGRLQQLSDFNILKSHLETEGDRSIEKCSFCGTTEIMLAQHETIAQQSVSHTKWRQPDDYEDKDRCCYSCYNHLLLYIKIEKILNEQEPEFMKMINCWRIVLTKCDEPSSGTKEIEEVKSSVEKNAVTSVEPKVKVELVDSEIAITLIEQEKNSKEQKPIEISPLKVETAGEQSPETRQLRKRKSESSPVLCETSNSLPIIKDDIDIEIDKFSLIKKRRSFNRPSILPSKKARVPKKPKVDLTVKQEEEKPTQTSTEILSIDQSIPVAAPEIEVPHKPAALPVSQTTNTELETDATSSPSEITIISQPLQPIEVVEVADSKSEQSQEPNEVNVSVTDSFSSQEKIKSNPMFGAAVKSQSDPLCFLLPTNNNQFHTQDKEADDLNYKNPSIELNLIKDLDVNLNLYPQLDDVGHEEIVDEFMDEFFNHDCKLDTATAVNTEQVTAEVQDLIAAFQGYEQRYNLKGCSIVIERVDHSKTNEVLAKWLEQKRITKSGRISKPKVIVDPSTSKLRKIAKMRKLKKGIDKPLKRLKSKHTKDLKIRLKSTHRNKIPKDRSDTLLVYPDEGFEVCEIEEAYVDYSTEFESSQELGNREEDVVQLGSSEKPPPESDDDDVIEVFSTKLVREDSTTTLEFLSPNRRDPSHYGFVEVTDALDDIIEL